MIDWLFVWLCSGTNSSAITVIGSSLLNARYYKLVVSANTFKSAIGSAEYVFIASCAPSNGTCVVTPTSGTYTLIPNSRVQLNLMLFSKKLFAGVTAVSWDVCLCYCMRRMRNCFVEWLTIRNIVFTSYYLRKKFYLWNFVPLIVYSHCHNVIITCTSVRL